MPRWLPEPLSQFGYTWRSVILRCKQLVSILRMAAVESVRLQDGKTIWRSISIDTCLPARIKKARTQLELTRLWSCLKASCWLLPQLHWFLKLRRSQSGLVFLAKFGVNLPNWLIMPRNQHNSVRFFGSFIFWIALTLFGSAWMPCLSTSWPKNLISLQENSYFSKLSVISAAATLCNTAVKCLLCSSWDFP